MSRCHFIIKSTFFIVALDYLIAFGYLAQLEVLHHLLYVISSTLKEWSQACFHNLRPWLHHCPKKVKKEDVTITTANSEKCHSKYWTLHPGTGPECADNLQLLKHPFLKDKCDLLRHTFRTRWTWTFAWQSNREYPMVTYRKGVTEKSEMIQMETNVLPKRETLCLTRADILQKILRWKGKKNTENERKCGQIVRIKM